MKNYLRVLQNYATFSGRASRSEFWYFALFNVIFSIATMILDSILGLEIKDIRYGTINLIYSLSVFIPGLAVSVRRLHDIGKSGIYLSLVLIPFIGAIWLIVLLATEGDRRNNKYGASPKNS